MSHRRAVLLPKDSRRLEEVNALCGLEENCGSKSFVLTSRGLRPEDMRTMKMREVDGILLLLALLLASAGAGFAQQPDSLAALDANSQQARPSYLFVSPNTSENLTLKEALRRLNSPEEIALILDGRAVSCRLGLKARIAKTIGSWTDGVEHSTLLRLDADEDAVRYANAWLGKRARQKSVLYFQRRTAGAARMYVMSTQRRGRGLAWIAKALDESGIAYRTLVPSARRTLVYVVDLKDELRQQIAVAARRLRARYRVLEGTGDFIGDDTDRDKARQVFSQIISKYEAEHPPVGNNCAVRPGQAVLLKKNRVPGRTSSFAYANQF